MENVNFDYDKIVEQSESLLTVAEKIEYYKQVLESLNNYIDKRKTSFPAKATELLSPEERVKYFENISAKNFIRTKIFLEELESLP